MLEGTIIKGIGGFYYVDTKDGIFECRARGKFRKEKITPLVGDYAEISVIDNSKKTGSLDKIKPRKNMMIRPKVANVDQVIIVFAAVSPDINVDLLDRFLVLAARQNIEAVICINKIDIDKEEKYKKIIDLYSKAGYRVLAVSAFEKLNIEELRDIFKDKITAFAGPSGVGKSSIVNAVNPLLNVQTGTISEKIERGKHTTRHAELMEIFEGSYIVDSPGFTSLSIEDILPEELENYFPEFKPYVGKCYFSGCSHVSEPDCEIKKHVGNEITKERYERYLLFYDELKNVYRERKK
jgi:ribosome biogenesis GTPase